MLNRPLFQVEVIKYRKIAHTILIMQNKSRKKAFIRLYFRTKNVNTQQS